MWPLGHLRLRAGALSSSQPPWLPVPRGHGPTPPPAATGDTDQLCSCPSAARTPSGAAGPGPGLVGLSPRWMELRGWGWCLTRPVLQLCKC